MTPALVLVAPVGMDEEAQATWFASATLALDGFSGREIAAGVKAAMRKADHPAKVVPAIVAEIEAMADYSRDTGQRPVATPAPRLPAPATSADPLRLRPHEVAQANANFRRLGLLTRWRLNERGEVEDDQQHIEEAA